MTHDNQHHLLPGKRCPDLDLPLLDGGRFNVNQTGQKSLLLIFYRGLHCPKCKEQLQEFDQKLDAFTRNGTKVVALSMDTGDKAKKVRSEWDVKRLPVAFGLSRESALEWGLYLSAAEFDYEPAEFSEPGLFLIEPDRTIYAMWTQTTPFARPQAEDLLSAIEFIQEKKYPPRGKAA